MSDRPGRGSRPEQGAGAGPDPGSGAATAAVETARDRWLRQRAERQCGPTTFLEPPPPLAADTLWRGLTRGGEVRVLVARTTRTVAEAVRRQDCDESTGQALAEWITGTLLVRSTLNPEAQLQTIVREPSGRGRFVIDVLAGGDGVRASVASSTTAVTPEASPLPGLAGAGILEIARSRARGEPYRSLIEIHPAGVEETLMSHLLESEQILAVLRLSIAMDGPAVRSATGFLVQVTPEGTRADLARLVRSLEAQPALTGAMTADDPDARGWAEDLLRGYAWDQCAREEVRWRCRCSRARVLALLSSLPAADIAELAAADRPHEVVCEFCRECHRIAPHELASLIGPAS